MFFIVGPTATRKSEIAADVAQSIDAEIVSADAFQIYSGLDLLSAKPDRSTRAKAVHHLIGVVPLSSEMNAERFRRMALEAIGEINSRGKQAIVVGGSGLYVKALTHGFSPVRATDLKLRAQLNELDIEQLRSRLVDLDPESAVKIDLKNRRRVVRAIEICLLTGKPISVQRPESSAVEAAVSSGKDKHLQHVARSAAETVATTGVFVFRDRDELYERINRRVEAMVQNNVIEEVRRAGAASETASKMIGLREMREVLGGNMSISECVAQIQQATRRYAKRQLTWFRRQTNFEPLNLSLFTHNEAVKRISQLARAFGVAQGND